MSFLKKKSKLVKRHIKFKISRKEMVKIRTEISNTVGRKTRKTNKNNFRHFETFFQMVLIFVYFPLILKKMSYLVLQTSKFLTKNLLYFSCFSSLFNVSFFPGSLPEIFFIFIYQCFDYYVSVTSPLLPPPHPHPLQIFSAWDYLGFLEQWFIFH